MSAPHSKEHGDFQRPSYTTVFERPRTLGRLLSPMDFTFYTEPPKGLHGGDIVLHISCQVHSVSHIPYLAQKILERLELSFTTLGGPENCCGSFHWHMGEDAMEAMNAEIALAAFQRLRPVRVLSLCPDCDASFARYKKPQHTYEHMNIARIFVEHLDRLKALMIHPVKRRVAVHEHHDCDERRADAEIIRTIVEAIPGIEIIETPLCTRQERPCSFPFAPLAEDEIEAMFAEAQRLGVQDMVVPYHSCYRQHCKRQLQYGVEVQYYLALVAQAMGLPYDEPFKELRMLDDLDAACARVFPRARELGYSEEQVRFYIESAIYI